jgi:hypothetical protein
MLRQGAHSQEALPNLTSHDKRRSELKRNGSLKRKLQISGNFIRDLLTYSVLDGQQVVILARELNHLLWTEDAPEIPAEVAAATISEPHLEILGTNMQCVAHAVVCAGIFLRQGEKVVTRGGSALVVYPELDASEEPHFVMKHWWITTSAGLCDLSLNLKGLSSHKPVVFANRNVADNRWKVSFTHDFSRALRDARNCHAAKGFGVFYQTDAKKSVTLSGIEADLAKEFSAALKQGGVQLRFIDIVEHCERVLEGGQSLQMHPQMEAWRWLMR